MLNFLFTLNLIVNAALPINNINVTEFVQRQSYEFKNSIQEPEARLVAGAIVNKEIPVSIILAIIEVESRYDKNAKSKKNCRGLMQLSLGTAKTISKRIRLEKFNLFKITDNLQLGIAYLTMLIQENENIAIALTIYNRGWQGFVLHGKKISGYAKTVLKKAKIINENLKNDLSCEIH